MYENQLLMAIDYIVFGRMSYFAHKKCALKHSSQAMEVRVSEMWSQSLKEIQSESLTGTERERWRKKWGKSRSVGVASVCSMSWQTMYA